ncbi:MAG: hypothetical protein QOH79_237 [Acidimicrobiaceae bacterium]
MPGRRALIVGASPLMSGGEISLVRALAHLPAHGWECATALVVPVPGDTAEAFDGIGLAPSVFRVGRIRQVGAGLRAVRGLAHLARQADVIHANDIRAALYCQPAALLARKPWTFHARDLYAEGSGFERSLRFVRPTRVVAMSEAIATRAASLFSWPPDRIDVVHSGLDAPAYRAEANGPAWRASVGLASTDVAVGIVGRLVEWKGQDDVLRAAAVIGRARPEVRFFIVGGELVDDASRWSLGREADRLRRLAAALGIADRVTLTGPTSDVSSVMAGLDIAVTASWAEPFGLVVLEAMAHGTAVVATRAGGIPEIVVDAESGMLVPPRSPADLAAAIDGLVAEPERRRRLGEAGRRRAAEAFPVETEAVGLAATWGRIVD